MGKGGVDWQSLADGLHDGMVVADGHDRILHINPAACRLLACEVGQMMGTPLEQLFPVRLRRLGDEPVHRFLTALATQRDVRRRLPILRLDGVEIVVECTVSEATGVDGRRLVVMLFRSAPEDTPFTEEEAGIAHDAAASERRYRLVFENAPLGIFHFDETGVITACNDVFVGIIGSSKRLLIGLDMTTLPNEDIVGCVEEAMAGRHADYEGDYRSATADKVTPVHVHFAPIFDHDQRVAGGVGIVEDVTERKEAERALARAERMASLGTLAAGVAHEINNPLTYVITSIDVARARLETLDNEGSERARAEAEQALTNARDGAERVRLIVRDLKTFVRADDERAEAVDLVQVLEAAIKLAWNEIRHRARLVRSYQSVEPVFGSESRLVQVFVNLLVNAAQAIPEGDVDSQRIEVRIAPEGEDRVRVEVEDTGAGIPTEALDRIFEPFWSDRPGASGTGLGLSIVHGIVTSLGGGITVESEPGKGTVFRVVLPAAGEAPREVRVQEPPPDARAAAGAARILVIDDEARLAQSLKLALDPRHEVIACTSGTEAIDLLRHDQRFDLVLCDLMLPDTAGPEIYQALRDEHPELVDRFVFMTGGAFTPRTRDFLRSVNNPRLEKPFATEEIDQLLERRPINRGAS